MVCEFFSDITKRMPFARARRVGCSARSALQMVGALMPVPKEARASSLTSVACACVAAGKAPTVRAFSRRSK
ncbi:hypothetical protein D3C75_1160910 [compost metagenome]